MIFKNRYNDNIFMNVSQSRNFLKVFNDLYQLQKDEPKHWFPIHMFKHCKNRKMIHKYLLLGAVFGLVRIRTDTFPLEYETAKMSIVRNIRHYKYRFHKMDKARRVRNVIIESINEKDKMMMLNCRTGEKVIVDDEDGEL